MSAKRILLIGSGGAGKSTLARRLGEQTSLPVVRGVKAVFSHELPYRVAPGAPGSISFVPGSAGLALAGEIIREIAEVENK